MEDLYIEATLRSTLNIDSKFDQFKPFDLTEANYYQTLQKFVSTIKRVIPSNIKDHWKVGDAFTRAMASVKEVESDLSQVMVYDCVYASEEVRNHRVVYWGYPSILVGMYSDIEMNYNLVNTRLKKKIPIKGLEIFNTSTDVIVGLSQVCTFEELVEVFTTGNYYHIITAQTEFQNTVRGRRKQGRYDQIEIRANIYNYYKLKINGHKLCLRSPGPVTYTTIDTPVFQKGCDVLSYLEKSAEFFADQYINQQLKHSHSNFIEISDIIDGQIFFDQKMDQKMDQKREDINAKG